MAKQTDKKNNYFEPFVTKWFIEESDKTITLPLTDTGEYNFHIQWGDGNTNIINVFDDPNVTHTYATSGLKTVTINGLMTEFSFDFLDDGINNLKLTDVIRTGYTGLTSLLGAFASCTNLQYIENNPTWTKSVTSMNGMIFSCTALSGDVSKWNTSKVTDFYYTSINQYMDASTWDVGNGIDFSYLFYSTSFDGDISAWNVSKATNFSNMFAETNFNQDISQWDTHNVNNMSFMFYNNTTFNINLTDWDTSNVSNMSFMFFNNSSFNQNITNWDTSNVSNMASMFYGCTNFNQNISLWDYSSIPVSSSALSSFIDNTNMSGTNYDNLLIKLDTTGTSGITLGASGVTRTAASATAYSNLIGKGWTITDAGQI